MAPFFVPMEIEPELSAVGKEKLALRLQEWQSQQDLHKWKKTQHRFLQRNIELREQLDHIYEEELRHNQHHKQQLDHLTMSTASPQPTRTLSPVISQALKCPSNSIVKYQFQCLPNPCDKFQLQPYSALPMMRPIPCPPKPCAKFQLQPDSALPMVVLPNLPVPEQFQTYAQYLEAFNFWRRWHCDTAPGSLELFHIYQTMN